VGSSAGKTRKHLFVSHTHVTYGEISLVTNCSCVCETHSDGTRHTNSRDLPMALSALDWRAIGSKVRLRTLHARSARALRLVLVSPRESSVSCVFLVLCSSSCSVPWFFSFCRRNLLFLPTHLSQGCGVYVYIYTHMYIYTHVFKYVHMHVHMYMHGSIYLSTYIHL